MITEPTINIEFTSSLEDHLKELEQRLRHTRGVEVDLIEPRDPAAPALFTIGIEKRGEAGAVAAEDVAQTLYDFLRADPAVQNQKRIFLVTIEGERTDIEPLSVEQIRGIIISARERE